MTKLTFSILFTLCLFCIHCSDSGTNSDNGNTAPVASFTITPDSGSTTTLFEFDASGCSDTEDELSSLSVRWDWESDDTWDTEYSSVKQITYKFNAQGYYTVRLEVKDSGNLTHTATRQISVTEDTNTVTDTDGNVYKVVKIGDQYWMAENLSVTHYRNGDAIGTTNPADLDITSQTSPTYQWSYYGDEENVNIYGRLYTGHAVLDSRNICPEGWHIPSYEELNILVVAALDSKVGVNPLKEMGTVHWEDPNTGATYSVGFDALPAGIRNANGVFDALRLFTGIWSTTEYELDTTELWNIGLHYNTSDIYGNHYSKSDALSVRCIKD
ncbi:MAG: hypothetical protein JXR46_09850 [Calditrichaceae bacterium]|nr:hypothetical protein [Calditrichaceae bacterium]MBN2709337.1 hypothetical protein [Calditrichaceae bacterium]